MTALWNATAFNTTLSENLTLSDEDDIFYPPSLVIPITVVYAIIFLIGVVGNVSTCIVISCNKSMHTATNYYLFSLAISDMLLLISALPPEMYRIWSPTTYIFGEAFCILQGFAAETSANATVLTITGIYLITWKVGGAAGYTIQYNIRFSGHGGALRGHLPPLPVPHHVEALPSHPLHRDYLDRRTLPRRPPGHPVRRHLRAEERHPVQPVHRGVELLRARFRDLHVRVLRRAHDSHHRAVRAHRDTAAEVEEHGGGEEGLDEEQQQLRAGEGAAFGGAEEGCEDVG